MSKNKLRKLSKKVSAIILCLVFSLAGAEMFTAAAQTTPEGSVLVEKQLSSFLNEKIDLNNAVGIIEDNNAAMNELYVQLNDGTTMLYTFSEDIKYEDENGKIKYKDTTIQEQEDVRLKQEGYEYTNGENDISMEFAENVDTGIKLTSEYSELTLIPVRTEDVEEIEGELKEVTIGGSNTEEAFVYENVFGEGSRVEYLPQLNGLKENIVLDQYNGINTFDFILDTHGNKAELANGRIVEIREDSGELINIMAPLFAYDSHEDATDTGSVHYTEDCEYTLTEQADGTYKLTVTVSEDWLTAPTTVYPVTIDPTAEHTGNIVTGMDAALYSGSPDTVFNASTNSVGRSSSSSYRIGRSMFKFAVPSAVSFTEVLNANYYFYEVSGQTSNKYIGAHMINSAASGWTSSTATWNLYADAYEATQQSRRLVDSSGWHSFGIKTAAQKWANGSNANRGIMLVSEDETSTSGTSWRSFCSNRHGTSAQRPYGVIQYQADTEKPVISSIAGNPTAWTNKDVKLTVTATDNAGVKEYSFSNSTSTYNWQSSKTSEPYASNQTVYVRTRDYAGNISSYKTVTISKIDKTAPTVTVTGNPTTWVKTATLAVSATDSASGISGYSFDGEDYSSTKKTKTYNVNLTATIKVKDKAGTGNVTTKTVAITKIDSTPPSINSVNKVIDGEGNTVVVVVATDSQSGVKEYSFDNGVNWQQENMMTFEDAPTGLRIKVRDNVFNEAAYTPIIITEITHAPNTWTSGTVTVTIQATSTTSGIKDYSFDGGETWQTSKSFAFTEYAKNVDVIARNNDDDYWMETIEEIKIDKEAPEIESYIDVIDSSSPTIVALAEDVKSGTDVVKWETGIKDAAYFNTSGNVFLEDEYSFNGEWDATYTIYSKDMLGHETVQTITAMEPEEPIESEEDESEEEELTDGSTSHSSYGFFENIVDEETLAKYYIVLHSSTTDTENPGFNDQQLNGLQLVALDEPIILMDANDCEVAKAYNFSYNNSQGFIILSLHTGDLPYHIIEGEQFDGSHFSEEYTYYYFTNLQTSLYELYCQDVNDVYSDCITQVVLSETEFNAIKDTARSEFENREAELVELYTEDNLNYLIQLNNYLLIHEKELQNVYGNFKWQVSYENVAKYLVKQEMSTEEVITFISMQDVVIQESKVVYDENEIASAIAYTFAIYPEEDESEEAVIGYIVLSTHTKRPILLDFNLETDLDEDAAYLYYINETLYIYEDAFYDLEGNLIEEEFDIEAWPAHDEEDSIAIIESVNGIINEYLNEFQNSDNVDWAVLSRNGGHDLELIYALQFLLCNAGYETTIDGNFSATTETAIESLQSDFELAITGTVNEETFKVLTEKAGNPKMGTEKLAVQAIQHLIRDRHGYSSGPQKGSFGYVLQRAIDDLQQKCEVVLDGMVGYDTWIKLFGEPVQSEENMITASQRLGAASTYGPAYGVYYIKNVYSGKYLSMTRTGAQVVQYSFHGRSNQMWRVRCYFNNQGTYLGFKLVPLYREVRALKTEGYYSFFLTMKYSKTAGRSYWDFMPIGNGVYLIYSHHTMNSNDPHFLRVENKSNNTPIQHVEPTTLADTQYHWKFERMVTKLESYKINQAKKGNDIQLFAGFDVSDGTVGKEEQVFRNGMNNINGKTRYKEIATLSNRTFYKSPITFRAISRAVDVAYINSHGSRYAYLYFSKNLSKTRWTSLHASFAPNKDAAKAMGGTRVTGIGTRWLYDGKDQTNSLYTKTAKYLILGGCGQLNHGPKNDNEYNAGPFWDRLTAAQLWARTMRGDGKKLHGILGYYRLAPKTADHIPKLESFLNLLSEGKAFTNAWYNGNGNTLTGGPPWAILIRDDCLSEKATEKVLPLSGSSPIRLIRYHHLDEYPPLTPQQTIFQTDHTYQFHEINYDYHNIDANIMMRNKQFSTEQKNHILSILVSDKTQSTSITLDITDDGKLNYKNDCFDWSEKDLDCGMSQEEAIDFAKSKLSKIGLLPVDNYRIAVDCITSQEIPLNNFEFEKPKEVLSYTVRFIPVIHGRDVLTEAKNAITVTLCKNGVSEINYNWKEPTTKPIVGSHTTVIKKNTAMDIYLDELKEQYTIDESLANVNIIVSEAYVCVDDEVKKAWVFGVEEQYTGSVIIDQETGDIIDMMEG